MSQEPHLGHREGQKDAANAWQANSCVELGLLVLRRRNSEHNTQQDAHTGSSLDETSTLRAIKSSPDTLPTSELLRSPLLVARPPRCTPNAPSGRSSSAEAQQLWLQQPRAPQLQRDAKGTASHWLRQLKEV